MPYIKLAESKKQILKIDEIVKHEMLLVGGLAVNQYVSNRQSEDIDLICDSKDANYIIDRLYPTIDWERIEENDDNYRPAFRIKHRIKDDYPVVKFGPKMIERGMYNYIHYADLQKNCKAFRYNKKECTHIFIPSLECLCYMKVISFLGRSSENTIKLENDLKDIIDLCNHKGFNLYNFINLIRKNEAEGYIHDNFNVRLSLVNGNINECHLGFITNLFYPCVVPFNGKPQKRPQEYLVAFDLDGTLIKGIRHSWTLLWNELGVNSSIQIERKNMFKQGKISYLEWVQRDTEDLINHGLNKKHIANAVAKNHCTLTKNLDKAVSLLKDQGCLIAIISGGVDAILYELFPNASDFFDDIYINRFIFDDNGNLQRISATEYDWDDQKKGVVGKKKGLERLCEKYSIPIENTVFVGDDLNDFSAMKAAGKRIFYCADRREFKNEEMPKGITIIPSNDLMEVARVILGLVDKEQL